MHVSYTYVTEQLKMDRSLCYSANRNLWSWAFSTFSIFIGRKLSLWVKTKQVILCY